MTRKELATRLSNEGISTGSYALFGENRDNAYVLDQTETGWLVYFRERGLRDWEHLFATETEACSFLLRAILADAGTRR